MKIAVPIFEFIPTSGIAKHTYEVIECLSKIGHKIDIWTTQYNSNLLVSENISFYRIFVISHIFKSFGKNRVGFLIDHLLFALLTSLFLFIRRKSFDVIWNNGCGQVFYQDVITAASCHKADVIRRFQKKQWLKVILNPLNYYILLLEKYNYYVKNHRQIIAISNSVKKQLIQFYHIREDRINIVYHGVNLKRFDRLNKDLCKEQLMKRFNFQLCDTLLCFVANGYDIKGLDLVFKAIAKIRDDKVKLLIVGEDLFKKNKYKKMADCLGISQQVYFVGSTETVWEYMLGSDMFVFPTRMDAFGMVILEAMACELPIITTYMAGAAELLKHQDSAMLLENPEDYRLLAKYIQQLRGDKILSETIAMRARSISEQYTWDRIAEQHVVIFEKVLLS